MIEKLILDRTQIKLGVNKLNELSRLVYEIMRREKVTPESVLNSKKISAILAKKSMGHLARFSAIKQNLIERRYPNAFSENDFAVYFNKFDGEPGTGQRIYKERFVPEKIFIEERVKDSALAKRAADMSPGLKPEYIGSLKEFRKTAVPSPFDQKKREIFITRQDWDHIKKCPCTKDVAGCGYHVINLGFGCPFDCSYCFLQQYSNSPGLLLDANIEDFLPKIEAYINAMNGKKVRIGTGEFADSLALDHITEYSKTLVPFFAGKNACLELKTKSSNIENLTGLDHKGNTAVSWSVNPQAVIDKEESGTASLDERLNAADRCRQAGYKIGFHFDPVIYFEGWEKHYEETVVRLFEKIKDPVWTSVGALRFNRAMKPVIEKRFPDCEYIYGELVIGDDQKLRYYEALRTEMFRKMTGFIKKQNKNTRVYLCMENQAVWKNTFKIQR